MDWETLNLGEIGEFRNGVNFDTSQMGEGMPLINVKDITNHHFIKQNELDKVNIELKNNKTILSKKGDLFFVRSSVKYEGSGEVALLNEDNKFNTLHCGFVIRFRANTEKAYPLFLLYCFKSNQYRETVRNLASGATIYNISQEALSGLKVKLPPLPVQRRIAEVLGRYDDLIENYAAQIRCLEAAAQNLYREWFVRGRCPFAEYEKDKKLPVGWEVKELGDLVETQYGFTASATDENTGVKFLRITDISGNSFDWDNVPFCEISEKDAEKYDLKPHDIVVARLGATAGYAKRLNKYHPKSVFASYLVRMQAVNPTHKYFLGMSVESDYFKEFINQTVGGAAQPQANVPVLISYETILPTDNVLEKFNEIVEPIFDKIEILQKQTTKLRQMRDKLLPRLLSGKLPVKVSETNGENLAAD